MYTYGIDTNVNAVTGISFTRVNQKIDTEGNHKA